MNVTFDIYIGRNFCKRVTWGVLPRVGDIIELLTGQIRVVRVMHEMENAAVIKVFCAQL